MTIGYVLIQMELKKNGSPKAIFETDEDRTFFVAKFPIHHSFKTDVVDNVLDNVLDKLTDRQKEILKEMTQNISISSNQLAALFNVSDRTIRRDIENMKSKGIIDRVGADNGGSWVVIRKK